MKRLTRPALFCAVLAASAFAAEPVDSKHLPDVKVEQPTRPRLDVVFVLDTTSSMSGLIEGAKQKIWSLASRMASGKPTPRIRVGLVAFRDVGDSYVTKRFDLTEDLDAMYKNLRGLQAAGGGDTPEHVGRGLGEAVKLMSWTDEHRAAKLIFLVGDAPAQHYQDGWDAKDWSKKAISKGIVVNTIRCGTDASTAKEFSELAKLADGTFLSLEQSGGMVATETPYDADLAKMNEALASKTLVGGSAAEQAQGRAKLGELRALAPSVAADRLSFNTKAAPKGASFAGPLNGAIDLTSTPEKLATLKEVDLPPEVRAIEKDKRESWLRQQVEEKQSLEKRVTEVSKQRDAWLSKNARKTSSFDDEVIDTVKHQAAPAGIAYE
jgi:Mg-chelatase subunit ChlD